MTTTPPPTTTYAGGGSSSDNPPPLVGKGKKEPSELDLLLLLNLPRPTTKDIRIAIVGGGVAGLVTARVLKSRGFTNLTLLEANDEVGGVWAYAAGSVVASDGGGGNQSSFSIQTPGSLYEFPDMPLPEPKDYTNATGVQKYCEDYVAQRGLTDLVRLNTRVETIARGGDDDSSEDNKEHSDNGHHGWVLTLSTATMASDTTKEGHSTEKKEFYDFVILATGLYSGEHKFIPEVEGMKENFKGKVCHSQDYNKVDVVGTATTTEPQEKMDEQEQKETKKGKQVVVIGFGKSAQDVVMNAAANQASPQDPPPILLFRQSHWCVPRKVLGLIPMEWLIYSRFGQGTLPKWQPQNMGFMESIFQSVGLIWLYWRIVELLFTLQLGWYGSLNHIRPTLAIENDMYCGHGVICHPNLFPLMKQGRIQPIKGEIEKVTPDGKLVLNNGTVLEDVDEIVFATGYRRQLTFLPQELKDQYIDGEGFYAYRHMFMPGVPNICFLNSNVTTFSNITTPGIQAAWLAELLQGNLDPTNILEDVQTDKDWRRSNLQHATTNDSRSIFIQLHQIRYWDRLLRDMGLETKRKVVAGGEPILSALANFFVPLASADYKTIVTGEELENSTKKKSHTKNYSPSWWLEWSILGLLIGSWTVGWKAMAQSN